jgi:hypothetical protein
MTNNEFKIALVCIAKNEDPYIEEWVEYNLKLGFTHIFIYENNWRCSLENKNITKIPFDGEVMQTMAYNHFIQNLSSEFDWAAFFDVDEFLVLKKHKDINEFINDYKEFNGIGINWVMFGSNGIKNTNGNYNVLSRFTKKSSKLNKHIKSIVKLNKNIIMSVHNPNTQIVNTNKELISGPFNPNGDYEIAQLNHYFTKSEEEFKLKIERGRADTTQKRIISNYDVHNSANDIEDLTAFNFYRK